MIRNPPAERRLVLNHNSPENVPCNVAIRPPPAESSSTKIRRTGIIYNRRRTFRVDSLT